MINMIYMRQPENPWSLDRGMNGVRVYERRNYMYLTVKQQVKHLSKEEYLTIKELCHSAKNLANEAIYNVRQHYFTEGRFLKYEKNYTLLKNSPNYKALNSNMAQQILREVDSSFKSFLGLLKLAKQGKYAFKDCKLPHYLPKNGYATLVIGFVRLNGNKLILPFSNSFKKTHKSVEITIPPVLLDKKVKEIRIIPKANARFFEIQYIYKAECIQRNLNTNNALALDLGINNLVTAVTSNGNRSSLTEEDLNPSISGLTKRIHAYNPSRINSILVGNLQTDRNPLLVTVIIKSMTI